MGLGKKELIVVIVVSFLFGITLTLRALKIWPRASGAKQKTAASLDFTGGNISQYTGQLRTTAFNPNEAKVVISSPHGAYLESIEWGVEPAAIYGGRRVVIGDYIGVYQVMDISNDYVSVCSKDSSYRLRIGEKFDFTK